MQYGLNYCLQGNLDMLRNLGSINWFTLQLPISCKPSSWNQQQQLKKNTHTQAAQDELLINIGWIKPTIKVENSNVFQQALIPFISVLNKY